ncbi:hypothetical protein D9M71_813790 [compost metagenome]
MMPRTLPMVASIWFSASLAVSKSSGCRVAMRSCSMETSMRSASRLCPSWS